MKTGLNHFWNTERHGMTLVELLAGIAIVGVLSSILITTVGNIRESGKTTQMLGSARSIATAYILTAQDNGGQYMMAYGRPGQTVYAEGMPVHGEAAKRYPWRLAGHIDGGMASLYVGPHKYFYQSVASNSSYSASLYPSFGINGIFVGGTYNSGQQYSPAFEPSGRSRKTQFPRDFWVLRQGDAYKPGQLIVFVSTISTSDSYSEPVGFFRATAPQNPGGPSWAGSYNPDIPANLGNVSLEYNNKAVVAHLDGSAALLNEEELRDMRRWSNQAAKFNDPDFSSWSRTR